MRGSGKWLVKPKDQIALLLPILVAGGIVTFLGYGFLSAVRYDAFQVFQSQSVDERVVTQFLGEVRLFFYLFLGLSLILLLLCLLWSLRASAKIFGPIGRLERDLRSALEGSVAGPNFKLRENDSLKPFFDLLTQYFRKANH